MKEMNTSQVANEFNGFTLLNEAPKNPQPLFNKSHNPSDPSKPLPPKEERFVQEYLKNDHNATQAYKTIAPNTTYKTMTVEGSNLLGRPSIESRISYLLNQQRSTSLEGLTQDSLPELIKATKEILTKDGKIEVKDNVTRLNAVNTALKLHGVLDRNTSPQVQQSQPLTEAEASTLTNLAKVLTEMNDQLKLSRVHQGEIVDIS